MEFERLALTQWPVHTGPKGAENLPRFRVQRIEVNPHLLNSVECEATHHAFV